MDSRPRQLRQFTVRPTRVVQGTPVHVSDSSSFRSDQSGQNDRPGRSQSNLLRRILPVTGSRGRLQGLLVQVRPGGRPLDDSLRIRGRALPEWWRNFVPRAIEFPRPSRASWTVFEGDIPPMGDTLARTMCGQMAA